MVNKIIWVSAVQFYNTLSVYCMFTTPSPLPTPYIPPTLFSTLSHPTSGNEHAVVCVYEVYLFIFNIFIDYAITVVLFPPLHSTPSCPPTPSHIPPPYSSCPWVTHISSLASTFPILFLSSPVCFLPTIYAFFPL